MKFRCDLPWGGHLYIEREPRKPRGPMEDGKFYALVILAGAALLVTLLLGSTAIRCLA